MGRVATMARVARALPGVAVALALALVTRSSSSAPKQARDYVLEPPPRGLWAVVDAYTVGAQGALELRVPIEDESTGMVHLRASSLASLGYGEVAGHLDARISMLTVGGSVGYRDVWRTIEGGPGEELTRDARPSVERERGRAATWPFAEGRARLTVPLESLFLLAVGTARREDGPANAFDWFHANVHDGGLLLKLDATLFVEAGAGSGKTTALVGRVTNLVLQGVPVGSIAAITFTELTRPGLLRREDLVFASVLASPGDREMGYSALGLPIWALVAYRAQLRMW